MKPEMTSENAFILY